MGKQHTLGNRAKDDMDKRRIVRASANCDNALEAMLLLSVQNDGRLRRNRQGQLYDTTTGRVVKETK